MMDLGVTGGGMRMIGKVSAFPRQQPIIRPAYLHELRATITGDET